MDGNRRWAKARGLPTLEGHAAGQLVLHDVTKYAVENGVKYISALEQYMQEFLDNDIRILIIGSRDGLPKSTIKSIELAEAKTAECKRATAAICFNYGGHQEILDATKSLMQKGISADDLTIEQFTAELYHPELPPIDLIVRTSGEQRLSNFMLWRAAYSELIFRDESWPDFTVESLNECLLEYSQRQRRFGG